jgi:hypothetical protein
LADGRICKNCGYQETDHDLGRAKLPSGKECRDYDDTDANVVGNHEQLSDRLQARLTRLKIGEPNTSAED